MLARLSAGGGVAASVYWNVNRVTRIGYAVDGRWLASFDYVCTSWSGPQPDRLAAFLDRLPLDDPQRSDPAALAVLERISGVRIGAEWLTQPHQTSVVVPATVFEPDYPDTWLPHVLPSLAAAASAAEPAAVRAAATHVATYACATAAITDPTVLRTLDLDANRLPPAERDTHRAALLPLAREAYRHGLQRRLDRARVPDESHLTGQQQLEAAMARGRAAKQPDPATQAVFLRAHAIGAAYNRLAADPRTALADAVRNLYLADRIHGAVAADHAVAML